MQKILSLLTGVKEATQGNMRADCPCPYHNKQNNQKLYLKDVGDMVLLDCKSGCSAEEVMQSIGLRLRDLYPDTRNDDSYRQIIAVKRQEAAKGDKAHRLWLELKIMTQALEARLFSQDKHPQNKMECWDREKQAIRILPKLLSDYYD